jgi:hypothetical protein
VSLLTAAELDELAARLESDDANIRRAAVREVGGNVSMVFDLMRERSREQMRLRRGDAEARAGMDKLMRWNRAARRQLSAAEFHDVGLIQLLPRIGTEQARALAKAISGGASADIRTATAEEALTIWSEP